MVLDRWNEGLSENFLLLVDARLIRAAHTEPHSKCAGHETKTMSPKKLKSSVDLQSWVLSTNLIQPVCLHATK